MKKLIAALMLISPLSWAGDIGFDEGAVPQTGTVSWAGGGAPLIGSDIVFNTILGTDTPVNSGNVLECRGCLLNFETGPVNSNLPGITEFDPGGTLSIVGTAFDGAALIADGVLASGFFIGNPFAVGENDTRLVVSVGIDEKHNGLEDYYGYGPNQDWRFASTQLALASCVTGAGFTCEVLNADFNNVAVHEPATLAVFGLGLAAMGFMMGARRRRV